MPVRHPPGQRDPADREDHGEGPRGGLARAKQLDPGCQAEVVERRRGVAVQILEHLHDGETSRENAVGLVQPKPLRRELRGTKRDRDDTHAQEEHIGPQRVLV